MFSGRAGGEIIDANDGVILTQQAIAEVRAKKSCGSSDKYSHIQECNTPNTNEDEAKPGHIVRHASEARTRLRFRDSKPLYTGVLRGLPSCAW